jgi:dTMP kinase
MDGGFINALNDFSTSSLKPDLTLLFDLPVEVGLARAEKRAAGGRPESAEDRFEQEDLAFHERIRKGYLTLAAGEPDRFRIIDGEADVATVHQEVCRSLMELL